MHTQIQCPVCTLYLHVGMNLHVHLDTHPKDQVIRALVNMTVTQNHEEAEAANQMQCSRYAPLQDETKSTTSETPGVQVDEPTTPIIESKATDTQPTQPLAVSTQLPSQSTLHKNHIESFSKSPIPPPPPYDEYVKLNGRKDSETSNQNIPVAECQPESTVDLIPTSPNGGHASYQFQDFQIIYDCEPEDSEASERMEYITNDLYATEEGPSQANYDDAQQLGVEAPTYLKYEDVSIKSDEPSPTEEPTRDQPSDFTEENHCRANDRIARMRTSKHKKVSNRRPSNGLHVLSDVTLTPDIAINSIINVRTLTKSSDRISLSDVFQGSSTTSALKSITKRRSSKAKLMFNNKINIVDIPPSVNITDYAQNSTKVKHIRAVEEKNATEECKSNEHGAAGSQHKSTSPNEPESNKRNIVILKVSSLSPTYDAPTCATTSVIRMASSPNKPTIPTAESTPVTPPRPISPQPSTSRSQQKSIVKTPFVKSSFAKQPKKLVVKFKTPFVPVIEEEANLQPPDRPDETPDDDTPALDEPSEHKIKRIDSPEPTAIDSHPFSPFRQSFTPGPEPTNEPDPDLICHSETFVPIKDEQDTPIIPKEDITESKEFPFDIDEEGRHIKTDFAPGSSYMCNSASTSASFVSPVSSTNSTSRCSTPHNPRPGPSNRSDYELCSFLSYSSAPRLVQPVAECVPYHYQSSEFTAPNSWSTQRDSTSRSGWTQCLSPQYVPFETDKSSYTNLDDCKTHSRNSSSFDGGDRTAANTTTSSDSVNIRTDEQMPAKGEISEQESNGDVDGSWSQQAFPLQDTMPRYTSSYDTTVARESWSLSNLSSETPSANRYSNNSTQILLPKFTPMDSEFNEDDKTDIKPNIHDVFQSQPTSVGTAGPSQPSSASNTATTTTQLKVRRFRCFICPKVFLSLKEKRSHLSSEHQIETPLRRNKVTATVTSSASRLAQHSSSNVPDPSNAILSILSAYEKDVKTEVDQPRPSTARTQPSTTKKRKLSDRRMLKTTISSKAPRRISRFNIHLLNFNWSVLRDRVLAENNADSEYKLPMIPTEANTFTCMVCDALFKSVRSFDEHMAIHPTECYTCGREFRHWYNFSIHLKRHLNIKDHQCKHCPKRFASRNNLAEHMTMHNPEARLQCKICNRRFRRQSNLIMHRKRVHLNIQPRKKDFICWCGEVFHSRAKIAWHREIHDKTPKCCPYCRERFVHKNSLSRHIRISHTDHFIPGGGTEMVTCTICSKKFLKTSLKLHMVTHDPNPETNGALEFGCTICNKSFTTKWNLKQHQWVHASHSSKPFRCTKCPKAFVRESDYTTHVHTHKSIKPYTCDHCGLQFARKYNWLRHTREHEKPKGHKCDDCGKIFHRAYYLKEHRRTHTGERPFECVICGKTSTTKTNHNKHVKIHHARDPLPAEG